jgi:hypothetical protein
MMRRYSLIDGNGLDGAPVHVRAQPLQTAGSSRSKGDAPMTTSLALYRRSAEAHRAGACTEAQCRKTIFP